MTWIQTYTGKQFFPLAPKPEAIDIEDIAHALSMTCRFTGHCLKFYSVAQHSYLVSTLASTEESARWGLLHDAAEAYIADVAKPVKSELAGYAAIEARLESAIAERFGLSLPMPAEIKLIDSRMLMTEKQCLMSPSEAKWASYRDPYSFRIVPWNQANSKRNFLRRFDELFPSFDRPHV